MQTAQLTNAGSVQRTSLERFKTVDLSPIGCARESLKYGMLANYTFDQSRTRRMDSLSEYDYR